MIMNLLLLGATGYIGTEFASQMDNRNWNWKTISSKVYDYTYSIQQLDNILDSFHPDFVINAAGYTGKPNVDACESDKINCNQLNAIYPLQLRSSCHIRKIPFLHVSSGCIYAGGKVDGEVYKDLKPHIDKDITGFTEKDPPNFCFEDMPCSYYSGTKALGEKVLDGSDSYICRLRIPFEEIESPRNYITKLFLYDKFYNDINSISNKVEYVSACLDLIEKKAPYGIYNVVNPGYIQTRDAIDMIVKSFPGIDKSWEEWNDEEFAIACKAPRSNCVLDSSKLAAVGINMTDSLLSLEQTINKYKLLHERVALDS